MIEIGKMAPAFGLKDQDGKTVKRSDLAGGWTLLYFHPKDGSPGCTVEAREFNVEVPAFKGLKARVLGVSLDSPEARQKFRSRHELGVDPLSAPKRMMMEACTARGEKNMHGRITVGVIRSTVNLDPAGRVAQHWKKVGARGHAEKVSARLLELQKKS